MKSIEEKAKEYSSQWITSARHQHEVDFIAGYNEAMRWRDPKEELPKIGESVIVKYRTAKNVEKHGIGKYFISWIIEGSIGREIIGWRPIE